MAGEISRYLPDTLRIDGTLGSITWTGDRVLHLYSEHPGYCRAGELMQQEIHVPEEDTFARLLADFVRAVRTGYEPPSSGRLQRRPLEIVMAAYRSMATNGQPMAL